MYSTRLHDALRSGARTALVALGATALAVAAPAVASAAPGIDAPQTGQTGTGVAISAAAYIDDVSPESPTGQRADGSSSWSEAGTMMIAPDTDVDVSVTFTNEGDVPLDLLTVNGDGVMLSSEDRGAAGDPLEPGETWTSVYTFDAMTIADGYESIHTAVGRSHAADANANVEMPISIDVGQMSMSVTTFVNDNDPESPTGTTPLDGTSQADPGPVVVDAGSTATASFVIRNTGDVPLVGGWVGLDEAMLTQFEFDADGLAPGESFVAVTSLDLSEWAPDVATGETTTVELGAGASADGYGTEALAPVVMNLTGSGAEATPAVGVGFSTNVNDVHPDLPIGDTAEGHDSSGNTGPVPVAPDADLTLSLSITNTGSAPMTGFVVGTPNSDDVLLEMDLTDDPMDPTTSRIYTVTLTNGVFGDTLRNGEDWTHTYGITSLTEADGSATDEDVVSLTALPQDGQAAGGGGDAGLAATGADGSTIGGLIALAALVTAGGAVLIARRRVQR